MTKNSDDWKDQEIMKINLALSEFDISSQLDLIDGLQQMGVTDVFDLSTADFTPLTTDAETSSLTKAENGVRVAIDEEGVTAASYVIHYRL